MACFRPNVEMARCRTSAVPNFVAIPTSITGANCRRDARVQIAAAGAENQRNSKALPTIIIAVLRTQDADAMVTASQNSNPHLRRRWAPSRPKPIDEGSATRPLNGLAVLPHVEVPSETRKRACSAKGESS